MHREIRSSAPIFAAVMNAVACSFLNPPPPAAPEITTSAPADNATAEPVPTVTPESARIRWWHYTTDAAQKLLLQSAARIFMQANPSVSIEITALEHGTYDSRLPGALQSSEPPDLFQTDGDYPVRVFADSGYLQDISDSMAGKWSAGLLPSAREMYAVDGRYYGAPPTISAVGFWYNKAFFQQAKISEPPATWSDLLEDVRKLKNAGFIPIALGEGDKWSGAFWWEFLALRLGGRAAFEDALSRRSGFDSAPFVQAGDLLRDLIAEQPFQPGFLYVQTYPDASGFFGSGNAAMHLMGDWEYENQRINSFGGLGLGADLGWFPLPRVADGAGDPEDFLGGGTGWRMGTNAPAAALEFLKFLSSAEQQCRLIGLGAMPASIDAGNCLDDPYPKAVWESVRGARYLQVYYDQYLPDAAGQAVNESVLGLYDGSLSPADAAARMEEVFAAESQ
jgi:raffinose/stachyose/melibiose transport system substrate-binding protein